MLKKLLAIILVCTIAAGVLSGCGKTGDSDTAQTNTDENTQTDTENVTDTDISDYYNGDELMLTSNGVEINWKVFNYFVNYYTSYVEQNVGTVSDWSTEYQEDYSYADFVFDGAVDSSTSFGAIAAGAKELGVELTQEDLDEIDQNWENVLASYDSEEAALADMEQRGMDEDIYKTISYYSALSDKCYAKLYGQNGSELTDEECAEYTAEDGYMMAKHILMLTTKTEEVDGTSQSVDMSEDEKAEVYGKMEDILAQLDACSEDEVAAKFDELMNEYSEDTGLASFPDGYLFQDNEMVAEFENAVKELNEYEYSGIVTTSYGYHIIMKLPINYDVVPSAYSQYMYYGYDYYTLRYLVSQGMYNSVMENWMQQAEVEYTDSLNKIDLEQLYK